MLLCRLVLVNDGSHGSGGVGVGGAGIVIEASAGGENDDADLAITEDGQLLCFLQQATAPLAESGLPPAHILNPSNQNLTPPHLALLS